MTESDEADLDAILKDSQSNTKTTLLPDELACLINAFLPSHSTSLHSKAYITLSAVCQQFRNASQPSRGKQQADAATELLRRTVGPPVVSRLSDTVEGEVLAGLSFLAALFEVDWQSASSIFQEEGVLESVMDALDLFSGSSQISLAVAQLLAQASGHKSCRTLLSSQHIQWLASKSRETADSSLRAAAAVALVKLSRGAGADATGLDAAQKQETSTSDEELVKLMRGLVVDGDGISSLADAIEGLAYMSTDPNIKEVLANDPSFLSHLFSTIPRRKGSSTATAESSARSPLYGVVVTILNLCSYRPRLSEEDAQISKLRRMANAPTKSDAPQATENALDDDDHVRLRGRKLIQSGVLDALTSAVRATESPAVRLAAGKSLLSLVEDNDNRGKVLQAGGAKALMLIIQGILSALKSTPTSSQLPQLEASDIEPIQALAKLAITASPIQVFGPNEGALYDAIRPFSLMLVHPTSNLLQRFEAMMALTNLSSQSGEVATRITRAEGLMNKVELLMLEEHTLIRRAATELTCNLIGGCEEVYNKYGGEKTASSKSKLQVLVALCDVDDVQTRLAASGAIAILTSSPMPARLCWSYSARGTVFYLFSVSSSIHPSPPAQTMMTLEENAQRNRILAWSIGGVVCIRNILDSVEDDTASKELAAEVERIGLVEALVGVVRTSPVNSESPALRPAAEALKWLLENGITISV